MRDKVNLREAFASFDELWQPHAAADVDGYQLKIAKIDGEFVWHAHDDRDGCQIVMFERAEVVNTGNAGGDRTVSVKPLG